MLPCFGDLVAGQASRELTQRIFVTHWQVNVPVAKNTQKFFQKSGFWKFSLLSLTTCSRVEAPVARVYRSFHGSLRDFLAGGPSSREKHLEKFLKNFVSSVMRLVLATCTRLSLVVKIACFAQCGSFLDQVSKSFHFSLASRNYSSSCSSFPLSNSLCLHINHHILPHLFTNL